MATVTEKSARMANPAHPDAILCDLYLEPMNVTIIEAAEAFEKATDSSSAPETGLAGSSTQLHI